MKSRFYYYNSNIKRLPKGLFFLILLLILILIPLLILLTMAGGAAILTSRLIKSLFSGRKKIMQSEEGQATIIDITPDNKHLY